MKVMIGTEITLNHVERELAKFVANSRHKNNRDKKVKNSKIGSQSDLETDLEGIASEIAFCKLFNLYPDLSLEVRNSTNDKGDALMGGVTIDVKTTKYLNGKLLAVPWKDKDSVDVYGLMIGTFPTYTFKGFMKSDELLKESRLGNLGYGDTYIAYQNELVEWAEIISDIDLLIK